MSLRGEIIPLIIRKDWFTKKKIISGKYIMLELPDELPRDKRLQIITTLSRWIIACIAVRLQKKKRREREIS